CALGDQADRRSIIPEGFQAAPCESVASLDWLIGIGCSPEGHRFAFPASSRELRPEHFRQIGLHAHARREAGPWIAVCEFRVRAGKAVDAAVEAALVRVERPVEAHVLYPVERRLGLDFEVLRASHW